MTLYYAFFHSIIHCVTSTIISRKPEKPLTIKESFLLKAVIDYTDLCNEYLNLLVKQGINYHWP